MNNQTIQAVIAERMKQKETHRCISCRPNRTRGRFIPVHVTALQMNNQTLSSMPCNAILFVSPHTCLLKLQNGREYFCSNKKPSLKYHKLIKLQKNNGILIQSMPLKIFFGQTLKK